MKKYSLSHQFDDLLLEEATKVGGHTLMSEVREAALRAFLKQHTPPVMALPGEVCPTCFQRQER